MATPEEIVHVGRKANTMAELEAAVRKFAISGLRRGNVYDPVCVECGSKSIITIDGADTCTQCGTSNMNNFTHYVSYNNNKDDYLKKKSHHKRVRWFDRHLFTHVAARHRDTIREQFRSIVQAKSRSNFADNMILIIKFCYTRDCPLKKCTYRTGSKFA